MGSIASGGSARTWFGHQLDMDQNEYHVTHFEAFSFFFLLAGSADAGLKLWMYADPVEFMQSPGRERLTGPKYIGN